MRMKLFVKLSGLVTKLVFRLTVGGLVETIIFTWLSSHSFSSRWGRTIRWWFYRIPTTVNHTIFYPIISFQHSQRLSHDHLSLTSITNHSGAIITTLNGFAGLKNRLLLLMAEHLINQFPGIVNETSLYARRKSGMDLGECLVGLKRQLATIMTTPIVERTMEWMEMNSLKGRGLTKPIRATVLSFGWNCAAFIACHNTPHTNS